MTSLPRIKRNLTPSRSFSPYNIAYDCTNAPDTTAFVNYLNLPTVREAIHAPNKLYADCNSTIQEILSQEYVEPPAYSIMLAILEAGVPIHIYAGDNDYFLNHLGARLAIQNMTWKGLQGLQEEPGQPFLVNGTIMGNWGSEVNLAAFISCFPFHPHLTSASISSAISHTTTSSTPDTPSHTISPQQHSHS